MLDAAFWFFLGCSLYALISFLIGARKVKNTYKTINAVNSILIHSLHTEILNAFEVKIASMKMTQLSDQIILSVARKDAEFLRTWKDTVHTTILSTVPENHRRDFVLMSLEEAKEALELKGLK